MSEFPLSRIDSGLAIEKGVRYSILARQCAHVHHCILRVPNPEYVLLVHTRTILVRNVPGTRERNLKKRRGDIDRTSQTSPIISFINTKYKFSPLRETDT